MASFTPPLPGAKVTVELLENLTRLTEKIDRQIRTDIGQKYIHLSDDERDYLCEKSGHSTWNAMCDAVICHLLLQIDEPPSPEDGVEHLVRKVRTMSIDHRSINDVVKQLKTRLLGDRPGFHELWDASCLFYGILEHSREAKAVKRSSVFMHCLSRLRFDKKIPLHFSDVWHGYVRSRSPFIGPSVSLNSSHENSVDGLQLYPFISLMIRRFLLLDIIPHQHWAVLFDISYTTLCYDTPIPPLVLNDLRKAVAKLPSSIDKVFIMLSFQLDSEYAGENVNDLITLWVVYLPDPETPKLTILSRAWLDHQLDMVQYHLIDRLQEIGASIRAKDADMTICLSKSAQSHLEKHPKHDEWIQCVGLESDTLPTWLRILLTNPIEYFADQITPITPHSDIAAEITGGEYLRADRQYIYKFCDNLLYLALAIKTVDQEDEMQAFTERCLSDTRQMIAVTNLSMASCLLGGDFFYTPFRVENTFFCLGENQVASGKSVENIVSRFFVVDGKDSRPPAVFCFGLGSSPDDQTPVTHSLVYDIIKEKDTKPRDVFKTVLVDFNKSPLAYLKTFIRVADEAS